MIFFDLVACKRGQFASIELDESPPILGASYCSLLLKHLEDAFRAFRGRA
jgi:hypothetical protein